MEPSSPSLNVSEERMDFTLPHHLFDESGASTSSSSSSPSSETVRRVPEMNDLSDEMLLLVMSYIPVPDLCQRIIPVCQRWRRLGRDSTLWKSLKFGSVMVAKNTVNVDIIKRLIKQAPHLTTFEYHTDKNINLVLRELAKNCRELQTLELQSRKLSHQTVEMLVLNCPDIRHLSLYKINGVTSTQYMPLANLNHLRSLKFFNCFLACNDNLMLAMAKKCTHLQHLNLQRLYRTGNFLSVLLSNCKDTLESLTLCSLGVTTTISLHQIAKCTKLEILMLFAINISDTAFLRFINLKNLQSLILMCLSSVSSLTYRAVFGHTNLKNLIHVILTCTDAVNDSVIKSLVENASSLQELSLQICINVTDDGLYAVVAWSKNLVYLNLEGMHRLHGQFLVGIESMLPQLRILRVEHCSRIDPVILKGIVGNLRKNSQLSVFTEGCHVYSTMLCFWMRYPVTRRAYFQVDFRRLNIKKSLPFELSSYVFRRAIL